MSDILHETDGGEIYGLGCNLPDSFPVAASAADRLGKVYTLDEIRATLSGKKSLYNRREVIPVDFLSNQRSTSACNGHATSGALGESIYVLTGEMNVLSGADSYARMNGNRDNGSTLADGMKVVTQGIALASSVPWSMIYESSIPASAKAERARFKGLEPFAADTEEEFASGLVDGRIGVVAVHVAGNYDRMDGDGVCLGGNGPGNHAVRVNDIRMLSDGTLVYPSPGSWGVTWGDGGHTSFTWARHFRDSVKYHRFWLLRGATEDPLSPNPPTLKE